MKSTWLSSVVYYELSDRFEVASPIDRTWNFFSTAHNLPRITPPWLNFTIDTPEPVTIQQDTVLDYTIRWLGVPVRWKTRIIDWSPQRQFIDLQIKGPYALWHHQHRFEPTPAGGVACSDRVIYKLPGNIIGRAAHRLMVKRQLMQIFHFRREAIERELGKVTPVRDVQVRTVR